jgi:hypothetical protein
MLYDSGDDDPDPPPYRFFLDLPDMMKVAICSRRCNVTYHNLNAVIKTYKPYADAKLVDQMMSQPRLRNIKHTIEQFLGYAARERWCPLTSTSPTSTESA